MIRVGLSISWLAVKGKERATVLRELGLAPTGDRDELPAESPIAAAFLDGGWYVIILDRLDHALVRDEVLRRLSLGCAVVAAGAEEHVGFSFAAEWRDGERTWSSRHDAQADVYDLEAEGALPEGFAALRRRQLDEQEDAGGRAAGTDHVFDTPLEAAKLVTGFSYDETLPEDGFAILAVAPAANG